jgi:hypothetical protein
MSAFGALRAPTIKLSCLSITSANLATIRIGRLRPIFFSPLHRADVKCIQDISFSACNYRSNGQSAGGIFALIGGDQPKVPHTPLSPAGTVLKNEEILE